ncbi:MAG: hypothetical protein ABIJ96_09590 [Elusimicrobiota bacterium]
MNIPRLTRLCFFAAAGLAVSVIGAAEPSRLLPLQGKLMDGSGNALTASQSISFSLYTTASGGAAFWTETQTVAPDADGLYQVRLGTVTPFSPALTFAQDFWLGVDAAGDGEMTPRFRFTSLPYVLTASSADYAADTGLYGADWTDLTDGGTTVLHTHVDSVPSPHSASHASGGGDTLAGYEVETASFTAAYSVLLATASGRVGIGTDTPKNLVEVYGGAQFGAGTIKSTAAANGDLKIGGDLIANDTTRLGGFGNDTVTMIGLPRLPHVHNLTTPDIQAKLIYYVPTAEVCISTYSTATFTRNWAKLSDSTSVCGQ